MTDNLSRRRFIGYSSAALAASSVVAAAADESDESEKEAGKLKIIGVGCSPRDPSTTADAVQACLEAAQAVAPDQIEIELIKLSGMRINGAVAAGVPLEPGERDDFPSLVPKLSDPAVGGIIIGSPVYFGNMSSLCKAFLERLMVFRKEGFQLSNKVAGVLAVGGARNGGQELTIKSIQTSLFSQEMIIVGESRPTAHFGSVFWNQRGLEKITDDEVGLSAGKNLGQRVAQIALAMAGR